MASVYWLTEAGEVEPQSVCTVDFSDEGGAVEFAHQLYRSVHGFACRRQGFTIKSDDGAALYTWRWTGGVAEDPRAEECRGPLSSKSKPSQLESAFARSTVPVSRPIGASLLHRFTQQVGATITAVRHASNGIAGAISLGRREQSRQEAIGTSSGLRPLLVAVMRQGSAAWRSLTRWERPIEPAAQSRVPSQMRPKIRPIEAKSRGPSHASIKLGRKKFSGPMVHVRLGKMYHLPK